MKILDASTIVCEATVAWTQLCARLLPGSRHRTWPYLTTDTGCPKCCKANLDTTPGQKCDTTSFASVQASEDSLPGLSKLAQASMLLISRAIIAHALPLSLSTAYIFGVIASLLAVSEGWKSRVGTVLVHRRSRKQRLGDHLVQPCWIFQVLAMAKQRR
ncbi:hypothetical protein PSPO01_04239 [Paraphaeosphaeria sporulosa]